MAKAVLDTTVLVSAFLNAGPNGPSYELLQRADAGDFDLYLSDDILEETAGVLLDKDRLRERYEYEDADVISYCQHLGRFATVVADVPELRVVRDPNDDMILAAAVAAGAEYLVTRDRDLLSLQRYAGIAIMTPEEFLAILRSGRSSS